MFGRKGLKAQIASLERELERAHNDLAVAVIPTGGLEQKIICEKEVWYRVGFMYRHTGAPVLDLKDVFFGRADPTPSYFTGETITTGGEGS